MWYNIGMNEGDTKCCKAMLDAGITDPESYEGILFCAGSRDNSIVSRCPYDYCVVVEHQETARQLAVKEKVKLAKSLRKHGVSLDDIALILGRSMQTVRGYLKK